MAFFYDKFEIKLLIVKFTAHFFRLFRHICTNKVQQLLQEVRSKSHNLSTQKQNLTKAYILNSQSQIQNAGLSHTEIFFSLVIAFLKDNYLLSRSCDSLKLKNDLNFFGNLFNCCLLMSSDYDFLSHLRRCLNQKYLNLLNKDMSSFQTFSRPYQVVFLELFKPYLYFHFAFTFI